MLPGMVRKAILSAKFGDLVGSVASWLRALLNEFRYEGHYNIRMLLAKINKMVLWSTGAPRRSLFAVPATSATDSSQSRTYSSQRLDGNGVLDPENKLKCSRATLVTSGGTITPVSAAQSATCRSAKVPEMQTTLNPESRNFRTDFLRQNSMIPKSLLGQTDHYCVPKCPTAGKHMKS